MRVIDRPVQRINNPLITTRADTAALFAQNAVIGVRRQNDLTNDFLAGFIDNGDQIRIAGFTFDPQIATQMLELNLGSGFGGFEGGLQEGF